MSSVWKRIHRSILVLLGKDPWLNLEEGVIGSRIVVDTRSTHLWVMYCQNRRKIDFVESFLRNPHMDFFFTFSEEFDTYDHERYLRAIPPFYLKGPSLFKNFRQDSHVKDWLIMNGRSSTLVKCIIKYRENIEPVYWGLIFEIVRFKTLDLLELESEVLKNLHTVCKHQSINTLLEMRWEDQPGFKKAVK